eukprot:scaffold45757_cov56-Attheya_sp.AAC.2
MTPTRFKGGGNRSPQMTLYSAGPSSRLDSNPLQRQKQRAFWSQLKEAPDDEQQQQQLKPPPPRPSEVDDSVDDLTEPGRLTKRNGPKDVAEEEDYINPLYNDFCKNRTATIVNMGDICGEAKSTSGPNERHHRARIREVKGGSGGGETEYTKQSSGKKDPSSSSSSKKKRLAFWKSGDNKSDTKKKEKISNNKASKKHTNDDENVSKNAAVSRSTTPETSSATKRKSTEKTRAAAVAMASVAAAATAVGTKKEPTKKPEMVRQESEPFDLVQDKQMRLKQGAASPSGSANAAKSTSRLAHSLSEAEDLLLQTLMDEEDKPKKLRMRSKKSVCK